MIHGDGRREPGTEPRGTGAGGSRTAAKQIYETMAQKKEHSKKHTGRLQAMLIAIFSIILCGAFALGGLAVYWKHQMNRIPGLSFEECLRYATKDNADALIAVGYTKDGEDACTVFGENGRELESEGAHIYEIGSVTKTFTAALIHKAILDGKLGLDDKINAFLDLPDGNEYPTVKELLTHTSGYKRHYLERPMISNVFKGRNNFFGVTKEMVRKKAGSLNMNEKAYGFRYSNYGYAVLGLVLEAVYQQDYTALVNDYCRNELGLANTKISDRSGCPGNYWDWNADDAYLPAGGITSNISDMLSYAKMQLDGGAPFSGCHKSLKTINASGGNYKTLGINMDEIGMAWIIDDENNIIWHNGGTGNYNSYIGFNVKTKTAVVVLSNLPPYHRIPATVLGIKLLQELEGQKK